MIVTHREQDAAIRARPRSVAMAYSIHGTIQARRLAVPEAVHALVPGAREQPYLLRSPNGGRGQILVDAGLKNDPVLREQGLLLPEFAIQATEGRAAVA